MASARRPGATAEVDRSGDSNRFPDNTLEPINHVSYVLGAGSVKLLDPIGVKVRHLVLRRAN
jgi:hypothetical protein